MSIKETLSVSLAQEQKALILQLASQFGISPSEYMRTRGIEALCRAEGVPVPASTQVPSKDVSEAILALNRQVAELKRQINSYAAPRNTVIPPAVK